MNESIFVLVLVVIFLIKKSFRFKIVFAAVAFFLTVAIRGLAISTYLSWLTLYVGVSFMDLINRAIVRDYFQDLIFKHEKVERQFTKSDDKLSMFVQSANEDF